MAEAIPEKIIVEQFSIINNPGTKSQTVDDIWNLTAGLYIYENIFSENMYGWVRIIDANNLYSNLPINKDSYLVIKLRCPTTKKVVYGYYKVYQVANIKQEVESVQSYTIHFVSVEMFNCARMRVSGKILGDFSSKISEYHKMFSKKPLNIEKVAGRKTIYLPNISPAEAIKLLSENMKYKGTIPDYIYWETFDSYNCKSITECMLSSNIHNIQTDYTMYYPITESQGYNELIRIKNIMVKKDFNSLQNLYKGYDGGIVVEHDPLTGITNTTPVGEEYFSNYFTYSNTTFDYVSLYKRKQLFKSLANTYYYVTVPGLLTRRSGDICDVNIQTKGEKPLKNRNLSGHRLICGIAHCIDNLGNYQQNLTLGDYFSKTTEA